MSRPFLNQVEQELRIPEYVESFLDHMKKIMTMLDAKDIEALRHKDIVFSPELISWIEQRSLDIHRG